MIANIIRNAKKTAIGGGGGGIVTDGDPYYSAVSLLLPMDGTNGSTTFTDSGPNALAVTATSATISTTQSKYGASGYFNGTSAYLTAASSAITLGTSDFTIEFWVYPLDVRTFSLYDSRTNETNPNGNGFVIGTSATQTWVVYQAGNRIVGPTVVANQWTHVAVTRSGSSVKMWINGVQVGSTWTTTGSFSDGATLIGTDYPKNARFVYGYVDDFRISLFARYTSTFTPSTAALPTTASSTVADPYYGYTSLLLHMDGSNASTTFTDSGPSALTVTAANSTISTTQAKYGGSSGSFTGTASNAVVPSSTLFNFGTGDFTIECWIYWLGGGGSPGTIFSTAFPTDSQGVFIGLLSSGAFNYLAGNGTWAFNSTTTSNAISANQWYHIAYVRSGSTFTVYINGVASGSTTSSPTLTNSNNQAVIGGRNVFGQYFRGFIDDLRVTKYARYTSAFAPPAQALPEYATGNDRYFSNTSLLLHMDGANGSTTFTDNSPNALTVTAVGSPTTSTTQLKFGTSAAAVGGTNYLTLPNNSSLFDFGLGDFTIEFWFYYSSSQSGQIQVAVRSANQSGSLSPWLLDKKSGTNYMGFSWTSGGVSWVLDEKVGTVAMTPNAWNHIAIVRRSGTFYSYINGTQDWSDSTSSTSAIQAGGDVLAIGRWPKYANSPGTYYIDDFRITKGVARYTANFTPEITAFPNA